MHLPPSKRITTCRPRTASTLPVMLPPATAFGCDDTHRPAPIEDILLVARDPRSIHGVGERDHGGVESLLVVEPQFGNHVEVRRACPCRKDRAFAAQIVARVIAYLRRDRQDEWRVAILVVVDELRLTEPGFAGQHRDYLDGHGLASDRCGLSATALVALAIVPQRSPCAPSWIPSAPMWIEATRR